MPSCSLEWLFLAENEAIETRVEIDVKIVGNCL